MTKSITKFLQGVNAIKSSRDTVVLDNGSTYRFEAMGENMKFVKLT